MKKMRSIFMMGLAVFALACSAFAAASDASKVSSTPAVGHTLKAHASDALQPVAADLVAVSTFKASSTVSMPIKVDSLDVAGAAAPAIMRRLAATSTNRDSRARMRRTYT